MTKLNCSCGKPKDDCLPFRKIVIPAVMGDDSEDSPSAPENGAYCNALVEYEANGAMYIYASDGIYTKISMVAGGTGAASVDYVDAQDATTLSRARAYADSQDAATLQAAKDYTDEHGGGGSSETELFFITATSIDDINHTFTTNKTYAEALEAYTAGKLLVLKYVSPGADAGEYTFIPLSYYVDFDEATGFMFQSSHTDGREGRVSASNEDFFLSSSSNQNTYYHGSGRVEVDSTLDAYATSSHAISNSAVATALQAKANTADLATVATSGSYADLTNKPTIPTFTLSTSDIGEGSPLAANNFYGVYE